MISNLSLITKINIIFGLVMNIGIVFLFLKLERILLFAGIFLFNIFCLPQMIMTNVQFFTGKKIIVRPKFSNFDNMVGGQIKYIPIFEEKDGVYYALFTKTKDQNGITIAGTMIQNKYIIVDLEKCVSEQFGYGMKWQWTQFTNIHTLQGQAPNHFTIIEYISKDQAYNCLKKNNQIVKIRLGNYNYMPKNVSGILRFFFSSFAKSNNQVCKIVNALKEYNP